MSKLTKEAFISTVRDLNGIIRSCEYENCYNKVVQFFNITSVLHDHLGDIYDFPLSKPPVSKRPLKGVNFFGIKSRARKQAEAERQEQAEARKRVEAKRDRFIAEVTKAGRNPYGINRTKSGEQVTEHNVYFGNIFGLWTGTVAKFEACEDTYVQEKIRQQIVEFVQSYESSFQLDWLG